MKKNIVILICSISLTMLPLTGLPQAGTLDSTFSSDGIAIFSLSSEASQANDLVTLPDSTLFICGYLKDQGVKKGFIMRVLHNGEVDSTFGTDGSVEFQMNSGYNTEAMDIIFLPNNKIIVSGQCRLDINQGSRRFFLARFMPDGSPDTTFNSSGHWISSYGSKGEIYGDITVQADGKYVLAGNSRVNVDILFMRVDTNGTIDTSFGTNGYTAINLVGSIACVGVLSNGTIVGAGRKIIWYGSQDRILLAKLTPDGNPMPGFGNNGVVIPDLFYDYFRSRCSGMVVKHDSLLLTGYIINDPGDPTKTFVAEFDSAGYPVPGFGTDGISLPDLGLGFEEHSGHEIFRQPDGKLYVCGYVGNWRASDFLLFRFTANGSQDTSFNNSGHVITHLGIHDYSFSVGLQPPNGEIVLAGSKRGAYSKVALARYLNDWIPPGCNANFSASPETLCGGDSVTFTDLSSSPEMDIVSWQWSFEGGTPASSTVRNPVITYYNYGEYNVKLIVSNGYNTDTLLQTNIIHVDEIPEAPGTAVGPTELCSQNTYYYTVEGIPEADEYHWQVTPADAGTITGDSTNAVFKAAFSWTGPFDIQVSGEGVCGTGPWSQPLTCELHPLPYSFQLSGTGGGGYCEGDAGSELTLSGSETGVDYELYFNAQPTGNFIAGTGNMISFGIYDTEGYYTAIGYSVYCQEFMLDQVYVHQWDLPGQAETPMGNEEICDNEISIYTTAEIEDADGYEWTLDPADAGVLVPANDSVTIIWNTGFNGNALLSVHGVNDCGIGPESEQLTIDVSLSPDPIISGPQYVVSYSEEQYQTEENPGNTYEWEVTGGDITSGGATHQVIVMWGDPGEGSLTVTEESTDGCSTTTNPYLVVIDETTSMKENYPEKVLIYPNPANETLHISVHADYSKKLIIKITTLEGKVVYSSNLEISEGENLFQITTANLTEGIYLLKTDNYRPARLSIIH